MAYVLCSADVVDELCVQLLGGEAAGSLGGERLVAGLMDDEGVHQLQTRSGEFLLYICFTHVA